MAKDTFIPVHKIAPGGMLKCWDSIAVCKMFTHNYISIISQFTKWKMAKYDECI